MSGALLLGETCDLAKAFLGSNANAVLFSLQVQAHPGIDKAIVCNYRRALEDRLMGPLAEEMILCNMLLFRAYLAIASEKTCATKDN